MHRFCLRLLALGALLGSLTGCLTFDTSRNPRGPLNNPTTLWATERTGLFRVYPRQQVYLVHGGREGSRAILFACDTREASDGGLIYHRLAQGATIKIVEHLGVRPRDEVTCFFHRVSVRNGREARGSIIGHATVSVGGWYSTGDDVLYVSEDGLMGDERRERRKRRRIR